MVMYSVIGVLTEWGAPIDGPQSDVDAGVPFSRVGTLDVERRRVHLIHEGLRAPDDAGASLEREPPACGIDRRDVDSKVVDSCRLQRC